MSLIRNRLLIPVIFSLFFGLSLFSLPLTAKWAHESSDLEADPRVTWGTLDNGLRYAIMENKEPPENVSLRLLVQAGSLMEDESQRGLAHFIEHMAFNGTKNYSPGEMIEYFQRLGMDFGADTNAHTSFDETVYKLELPKNTKDYLEDGIQVLRDFADGMLLADSEISEERGIIMSEKRDRDSIEWRTAVSFYNFIGAETLVPHRLPIGIESVITGATREDFVDFYKKWYTADRMALVIVGDVNPDQVKPIIEKHFGTMPKVETPRPHPELGTINISSKFHAMLHSEKEASSTDVTLLKIKPYIERKDSIAERTRTLEQNIATNIIKRRLDILSKKEGSPISSGSMYYADFVEAFEIAGIEAKSQPDEWEAAVALLEQELRKALIFGFTEDEIDEATANIVNTYEEALRLAPTRLSKSIASEISDSISEDFVFTSPQDELDIVIDAVADVSPESVLVAFKEMWEGQGKDMLFVDGNLELDNPEKSILMAYNESTHQKVVEPIAREIAEFAYVDFGTPAKVVQKFYDEKLDIYQIRFDNNVRLNLKQTNFESNRIRIAARFGGGELESLKQKPGVVMLTNATFIEGGLRAHSVDELERILAGKTVGVTFYVGDDAFGLSGTTNSKDFELQLKLMCAYMTEPGYRPEALRKARKTFEQIYPKLRQTPEGVVRSEVAPFLASNDPRFGFPQENDLMQRTLEEVKDWLAEPLAKSYLEISIVGDFENKDDMIQAVGKTFGALPKRDVTKKRYKDERVVKFPKGVKEKKFFVESEIQKAVSLVYWPTVSMSDIRRARQLSLLSEIFSDRLRVEVREKLGDSYSPYAVNDSSLTYKNYGKFYGVSTVTPEKVEDVSQIMLSIGDSLSENGITQDELERSLKPILVSIDRAVRNNGYWMNVLAMSQEKPETLEWAKTRKSMYESMTVEDMNKTAKKYLKPKKAIRVLVTPGANEEPDIN